MNFRQQLVAERRELLALCHGLGPAEWEAPSLCEGWRVRDVVAHIIGNDRDLGHLWQTRGDIDAANALSVAKRHDVPVQQLLAELAEIAPVHGVSRLFAGALLMDNWVHQEDIRRPLGRARPQNPARLRWILRCARLTPYSRAKELRVVATDLDLAFGRGPEVRGPAASLIMAVVGRHGAERELEGPGLAFLT